MKPSPKSVSAVYKYDGGQPKTKKKKPTGIEGRSVQDAYFAKELAKPRRKPPLEAVWDNILAKLPPQLQRNLRNTCRSIRQIFTEKREM